MIFNDFLFPGWGDPNRLETNVPFKPGLFGCEKKTKSVQKFANKFRKLAASFADLSHEDIQR